MRLIEEMLVARGYDLRNPVVADAEGPNIVRTTSRPRRSPPRPRLANADPGDVAAALESLAEIRDYLVEDRRTP